MWNSYIKGFKAYLQLERSLADNTVDAYEHDVVLLASYFEKEENKKTLQDITLQDLQAFLAAINGMQLSAGTQARVLSGIKSFYRFLLLEDVVKQDPTDLLEAPKLKRKLPDF